MHNNKLDSLRGIAAVMVTIIHSFMFSYPNTINVITSSFLNLNKNIDFVIKLISIFFNAQIAVSIFFILSALVLRSSLEKRYASFNFKLKNNHSNYYLKIVIEFLIKRIFRIFPALLFALIFTYFSNLLINIYHNRLIFKNIKIKYLENFFLLNHNTLPVSWTLQIEFYIIPFFLILFFIRKKFGYKFLIIPIFLYLIVESIIEKEIILFFDIFPLHSIIAFITGMLIFEEKTKKIISKMSNNFIALSIAILLVFGLFFIKFLHFTNLILCGLLIALIYHKNNFIFLENRFLIFIGKISYSYYILNYTILNFLYYIINSDQRFLFHDFSLKYSISMNIIYVICALVIGVVSFLITIPIAFFSNKFIEEPFIRCGKIICKRLMAQKIDSENN